MKDSIAAIRKDFDNEIQGIRSTNQIETIKVKYLGRKGPVQGLMKGLKDVPAEERRDVGRLINDLKQEVENRINSFYDSIAKQEMEERIQAEAIDVTLPGRRRYPGRKHIISQQLDDILEILSQMGFSVQYGPDIETDYYNFEALNFPPDHPALDMQDTFYITDKVLLRTHTSNVQTRILETKEPPIRIIAPGRAFRNETITARSHVFFHQVEILYVDRGVSFADLNATLRIFLKKVFHPSIELRFRPSFFPFVEPGMEVDVSCLSCDGHGCGLCKYTGWLEVLGAGMVHPEVLKYGGIDSEKYTGYAVGMGVERIALLKNGIKDIRIFSENDMRFLSQFPAV